MAMATTYDNFEDYDEKDYDFNYESGDNIEVDGKTDNEKIMELFNGQMKEEQYYKAAVESFLKSGLPNELVIVLINFSAVGQNDLTGKLIPGEVALTAFSLRSGIVDNCVVYINHGDLVPPSIKYSISNLLDLPQPKELNSNYTDAIWTINLFRRKHKFGERENDHALLFCRKSEFDRVAACLDFLFTGIGREQFGQYQIFPLEYLVSRLSDKIVPKDTPADILNSHDFNNVTRIACTHHYKNSRGRNTCPLKIVNQHSYNIIGALADAISFFPGSHYPSIGGEETEVYHRQNLLMTWETDIQRFTSIAVPKPERKGKVAELVDTNTAEQDDKVQQRRQPQRGLATVGNSIGPLRQNSVSFSTQETEDSIQNSAEPTKNYPESFPNAAVSPHTVTATHMQSIRVGIPNTEVSAQSAIGSIENFSAPIQNSICQSFTAPFSNTAALAIQNSAELNQHSTELNQNFKAPVQNSAVSSRNFEDSTTTHNSSAHVQNPGMPFQIPETPFQNSAALAENSMMSAQNINTPPFPTTRSPPHDGPMWNMQHYSPMSQITGSGYQNTLNPFMASPPSCPCQMSPIGLRHTASHPYLMGNLSPPYFPYNNIMHPYANTNSFGYPQMAYQNHNMYTSGYTGMQLGYRPMGYPYPNIQFPNPSFVQSAQTQNYLMHGQETQNSITNAACNELSLMQHQLGPNYDHQTPPMVQYPDSPLNSNPG